MKRFKVIENGPVEVFGGIYQRVVKKQRTLQKRCSFGLPETIRTGRSGSSRIAVEENPETPVIRIRRDHFDTRKDDIHVTCTIRVTDLSRAVYLE